VQVVGRERVLVLSELPRDRVHLRRLVERAAEEQEPLAPRRRSHRSHARNVKRPKQTPRRAPATASLRKWCPSATRRADRLAAARSTGPLSAGKLSASTVPTAKAFTACPDGNE